MKNEANVEAEQVTVEQVKQTNNENTRSGVFCAMCKNELDLKTARRKGCVTCPREVSDCGTRYRKLRRELIEASRKRCRSCGAPSNPAERASFKQWRKATATPRTRERKKKTDKEGKMCRSQREAK